jgi:hypothetical protein
MMHAKLFCSIWQALLRPFSGCFTRPGYRRFVEMKNAGLTGFFESSLSVEDVGLYKPHTHIYRWAARRVGVDVRVGCRQHSALDVGVVMAQSKPGRVPIGKFDILAARQGPPRRAARRGGQGAGHGGGPSERRPSSNRIAPSSKCES